MKRAGDAAAMDDPLRQRPALVRAAVVKGEDVIIGGAKQRDIAATGPHDARAERLDFVEAADIDPGDLGAKVGQPAYSTSARTRNSRAFSASLACADQGSF